MLLHSVHLNKTDSLWQIATFLYCAKSGSAVERTQLPPDARPWSWPRNCA